MFTLIEDGYVVLRRRGVFKPAKLYLRNGHIYAGYAGGFIRLLKHEGGTSCPDVLYDDLHLPFTPTSDALGRLQKPVL